MTSPPNLDGAIVIEQEPDFLVVYTKDGRKWSLAVDTIGGQKELSVVELDTVVDEIEGT